MKKQSNSNERKPSTKGIFGWIKEILHPYSRDIEELRTPPPERALSVAEEALSVVRSPLTANSSEPDKEESESGNPATGYASATENLAAEDAAAVNVDAEDAAAEDVDAEDVAAAGDGKPDSGKACCCPFGIKRNIVNSLQAIREFAEEHDLAASVVRALLSLLAEIALGALKGKVSTSVLEALLNVFNYERELEETRRKHQLDREELLREKNLEIEEAYRRGEIAGRNARIEEEIFPAQPKEVPNLKGMPCGAGNSEPDIFTMAKEA